MKAWTSDGASGPDGLRLVSDAPEPTGEVVIEVKATGVSFPELLLTQGKYQLKPEPPFTPGAEVAGVVMSAAEGSGFAVGDRVVGFGMLGGWAERVGVPAVCCFALPDALSWGEGAALVMNYHTAHFALVHRGRTQAGERVLVHGAAGGVGTAAIQVAKALGAHVVAVVSSEDKGSVASDAGADEVVLTDGWVDAVKASGGVDVVVDPVGGGRTGPSLSVLRPEGRLLVVGFADGEIPSIAANRLLLKNVSAVGVAWGAFALAKPEVLRGIGDDLERMIGAGFVRPVVGVTLPFAEAPEALRVLSERRATGKVVLAL
ncbi:MAG: NADPH:quinone reductase [Frankiales bacterium]|nr:NADPH:quinone reductase [Frankiales bacterium]